VMSGVHTAREPYAHARRNRDHRFLRTSSTRFSVRPSKLDPTRTRQSPTSISMVSETAGAGFSSGSGVIVTGTNAGVATSVAARKRRRQAKTWLALTSYCRATTETDAPGPDVAATISRFSVSGQRLFRRRSSSLVSTSDIVGTSSLAAVNQERGRLDEWTRRGKAAFTGRRHSNTIFNYLEDKNLPPILRELIARSSLPLKA